MWRMRENEARNQPRLAQQRGWYYMPFFWLNAAYIDPNGYCKYFV